MLQVGTFVEITKGCRTLGIHKGAKAQVMEIRQDKEKYGTHVGVKLHLLQCNLKVTLWAKHLNRLKDAEVRLNNGNPLNVVKVRYISN